MAVIRILVKTMPRVTLWEMTRHYTTVRASKGLPTKTVQQMSMNALVAHVQTMPRALMVLLITHVSVQRDTLVISASMT